MIFLFTDYGIEGPYVGQLKAVIAGLAPDVPVNDLMHDAPAFNAKAAAYILPPLIAKLPGASIVVAVVDPGVGGARPAVVLEAEGRLLVGPGNGLLEMAARCAPGSRLWRLDWRPEGMSASFHGRDLFAPAAAHLALGARLGGDELPATPLAPGERMAADWPDDLAEIIYIDSFGNAWTGLRAATMGERPVEVATAKGVFRPKRARTFSDLPAGAPLYYENAQGLMEIAVNQGRADADLGLAVGTPLRLL